MYSLRYGTLPIVRATGGLDDTVENYDLHRPRHRLQFGEASGHALLNTMRWRCVSTRPPGLAAGAARGDARRLVLGAFGPRICGLYATVAKAKSGSGPKQ